MILKSSRIDIQPLSLDDLQVYVKSRADFERMKGFQVSGEYLPEAYCEEITEMVSRVHLNWSTNNNDYLFFTLWIMVERNLNRIIGLFTFNGKPNTNGEVEVFFSIEKPYRKNGYATEVMTEILAWGSKSKLFKYVLIEADLRNKAAMSSLKKLGFQRVHADIDVEEDHSTMYYKKVYTNEEEEILDFDT